MISTGIYSTNVLHDVTASKPKIHDECTTQAFETTCTYNAQYSALSGDLHCCILLALESLCVILEYIIRESVKIALFRI